MEIVGGALRVGCCREDRALIVFQNLEPIADI